MISVVLYVKYMLNSNKIRFVTNNGWDRSYIQIQTGRKSYENFGKFESGLVIRCQAQRFKIAICVGDVLLV